VITGIPALGVKSKPLKDVPTPPAAFEGVTHFAQGLNHHPQSQTNTGVELTYFLFNLLPFSALTVNDLE